MQIYSDIAPLKEVILHRPDAALRHLTPQNCQRLLFDDVLWVERAAEEHRHFEQMLISHGVEVLILRDLLEETLVQPHAREWLIYQTLDRLYRGSVFYDVMYDFLNELPAEQLASYLLGGLSMGELKRHDGSLVGQVLGPHQFALPPLPNHLFTRDASCWVGNGVTINPMRFESRRGESLNLAAIYRFHPKFVVRDFATWYEGVDEGRHLPCLEGGDLMVVNERCVVIGIGQRTRAPAVENVARALFEQSGFEQVIAVEVPSQRASMHLDTVMTMASEDTFAIAFPEEHVRSWSLRPGDVPGELVVSEEPDLFKALSKVLGIDKINLIKPAGDYFAQKREQWSDASNLLAIKPGVCVVYDCNIQMNQRLHQEGIETIEIPGSELGRGRGGPRCMSCPTIRESAM